MTRTHDRRQGPRIVATIIATAGLAAPIALTAQPGAAALRAAVAAELPVFAVRSAGLGEEQVRRLARAFGTAGIVRERDGSVRFAADGFLAVPTRDGGRGRDEDGNVTTTSMLDVGALRRIKPLGTESALRLTARALAAAGLATDQGRPSARHSTLEVVDRRGATTVSAPIDTTVSYAFRLAGLDYAGPGAKIRAAFDGHGTLTGLTVSTRNLAAAGSVRVVGREQAQQRCARVLGSSVRVRTFDPMYFAPALSAGLERLEPSLRCSGVTADGSATQVVPVPAALGAALPAMAPPPPPRDPRPQTPGTATPDAPAPDAPAARAGTLGAAKSGALTDAAGKLGAAEDGAPADSGRLSRAYGRADVGSEGTGPCSGLPHTGANLATFNNRFTAGGVPVEFSWLDQNAWERDFKDPALGGTDSSWTDHVDLTYWQGHGAPTGFSFSGCSSMNDTFLRNTDARWGNGDVEWMSLFTCSILQHDSGGQRWWQRWGQAFAGLHQINSFDTVSYHSAVHGGIYANYLLRGNPMRVRTAWAQAAIDDQPPSVVWANMGAIGPGGAVSLNDYFWGKGPVSADVPATAITGYWYMSGAA